VPRQDVYRKDPQGNEWRASYVKGALTRLVLPSGATTDVTYSSLGQPLTWTDADGNVTTYT
jgi:YD repeat-containing protein